MPALSEPPPARAATTLPRFFTYTRKRLKCAPPLPAAVPTRRIDRALQTQAKPHVNTAGLKTAGLIVALGWRAKGHTEWWRKRERGRSGSPGWSVFCHLERCLLFLSTSSPPFISSPSSGSILCIHKGLEGGIRACESVNTYWAKGNRSLKSPRLQSALYHLLSPFADFVQHRMWSAHTVGVGLFPVKTTQLLELKYTMRSFSIYMLSVGNF